MPAAIIATVEEACPLPTSVREAWVEFAFWDKLGRDREARGTACGDHSPAVRIRCSLVEHLLNSMPAANIDDMRARLDWFDWLNRVETAPDPANERIRLATLRGDIDGMGERVWVRARLAVIEETLPPAQALEPPAHPLPSNLDSPSAPARKLVPPCAASSAKR